MRAVEIKLNSHLMYYGKEYIVISIEPPNVYIKRKAGDGETLCVKFYDLVTNPSFSPGKQLIKETENEIKKFASELEFISESKRKDVSEKFNIIRPLILLEKIKRNDLKAIYEFAQCYKELLQEDESIYELNQKILLQRLSKKYEKSDRSIKRYLFKYRQYEYEKEGRGEEGLISQSGTGYLKRRDNKEIIICHPKDPEMILDIITVRIDEKYIPLLKNAIENEYLTTKKISVTALFESIKIQCVKLDIDTVPYSTVNSIIKRIRKDIIARMRDGKKAGEFYDPVDRGFADEDALFPLHIVQIDHTELDMDVIDDETGLVSGRPWITLGIDVYSRAIWCMYVSFEPPSANRVRKALEHGIFFKKSKEKYKTNNEWDIFGRPDTIYLDNGPDFKSIEVKRMINETLKSNVKYRPVKTPNYGAIIERLFGTINSKLIHRLDGTRKSNVTDLGDYKPEEEAKLTLNDIIEILTIYIVDIYHFSKHKSLPLYANNPMARYIEGIEKAGYPEFIYSQDEEIYKIELMSTIERPYTRDGLRLNNIIYQSEEFIKFIGGKHTKYKVKYDLDDISYVYIVNPDNKEYIKMFASNPPSYKLENMSLYTYKKLIEILKEEGVKRNRGIPGTEQVDYALTKLKDVILAKYKKSRTIRQQAQRHNIKVTIQNDKTINNTQRKESLDDLLYRMKKLL